MIIKNIPLDKIVPNTYNPNVVPEDILEQLKKSIERDGFLQPIIVRVKPDDSSMYEIVDGEHRWSVLNELPAFSDAPCIVVEKDDNLAKIGTINMNKLRGEFDTIKLAEIIHDLRIVYSDEQLESMLGYDQVELQSYDSLLDSLPDDTTGGALPDDLLSEVNNDSELLNEFSMSLSLIQLDIVETALADKGTDRVESLVDICRDYLKANAPDKYQEVKNRAALLKEAEAAPEELGLTEEPTTPSEFVPITLEDGTQPADGLI